MNAKNTNSFLPEGYEVPQSGGSYMKFKQGQNKFRILSTPLIGYEYWTEDNKPVRSPELWTTIPNNARLPWEPKHFWAMVVWNHQEKAMQVLEITQKTILIEIQNLAANEDWGDPRGYNITVTRRGEGLKTEYSIQPSAPTKLPEEVRQAYEESTVDLNALFKGQNPFESSERSEELDDTTFQPKRPSFMPPKEEVNDEDVPF